MENSKYRAFIVSVESGSITKAAHLLGYTPSGVSQLIRALEKELGFSLLIRNKKGIEITENGKRVEPVLRELIRQENHLEQISSEIKGLRTGRVTIATYSSISSHWLPSVIKEFKELYPTIELHLMEGIRQEVEEWLLERRADIGFFSYKDAMPFEWFPLAKDEMVAVLPLSHPLAEEKCYPLTACQTEDFIMPALGQDNDVLELLARHKLTPSIVFSTLENFAALTLIEQELGMSIMNQLITQRWDCNVKMLPLDPPQFITLGIAVHSYEKASPAVQRFIQLARKRLLTDINP